MCLHSAKAFARALSPSFPMQLFSIDILTRFYFPARPFSAISMAPYLYSLLLLSPKVCSYSLFLIMAAI